MGFTLELEMKKQLAVFDFDKTISGFLVDQEGEILAHDVIFTDGQLPSDFKEMVGDWEAVRKYKIKTLNSRNLTKDQVWDILGQLLGRTRTLIDGMDKVIEYLSKDHDIILLSGCSNILLKCLPEKWRFKKTANCPLKKCLEQTAHLVDIICARDKFSWTTSRTKTTKKFPILEMESMIFVRLPS